MAFTSPEEEAHELAGAFRIAYGGVFAVEQHLGQSFTSGRASADSPLAIPEPSTALLALTVAAALAFQFRSRAYSGALTAATHGAAHFSPEDAGPRLAEIVIGLP
jgi:hypothetical protein